MTAHKPSDVLRFGSGYSSEMTDFGSIRIRDLRGNIIEPV